MSTFLSWGVPAYPARTEGQVFPILHPSRGSPGSRRATRASRGQQRPASGRQPPATRAVGKGGAPARVFAASAARGSCPARARAMLAESADVGAGGQCGHGRADSPPGLLPAGLRGRRPARRAVQVWTQRPGVVGSARRAFPPTWAFGTPSSQALRQGRCSLPGPPRGLRLGCRGRRPSTGVSVAVQRASSAPFPGSPPPGLSRSCLSTVAPPSSLRFPQTFTPEGPLEY